MLKEDEARRGHGGGRSIGGACCAAEADGRMWVTKMVTMANEIRYHWKLTEYMNVVGKHVTRES